MQRVFLRDTSKDQPLGTECLCFQPGALVHLAVAVLDIAQHRVAQIGKVGAYLMGAPGDKPNAAECERPGLANYDDLCDNLFVALALPCVDADLVGLRPSLPLPAP